jgi:hypothetical protein
MPVTISGTAGITYPAGGLANTVGAGVGTSDTQTLTNKTLTSPSLTTATLTTPNIDSAQVPTVSGTAPLYMCRAWVNFDGTTNTGGFCTIRASGNVTSVTDNSTGNYTINFTTAISDANYSAVFTGRYSSGQANQGIGIVSQTTSAVRVIMGTPSNNAVQDFDIVCASVFR